MGLFDENSESESEVELIGVGDASSTIKRIVNLHTHPHQPVDVEVRRKYECGVFILWVKCACGTEGYLSLTHLFAPNPCPHETPRPQLDRLHREAFAIEASIPLPVEIASYVAPARLN